MLQPLTYLRFARTAARLGLRAWKEGRLSASPRRWFIDLRHLRRQLQASEATPRPDRAAIPPATGRAEFIRSSRAALASFLASNGTLALPASSSPRVSILLVLFNRAELTLRCLESIAAYASRPFEVVIVDNGSTDETAQMLERVEGAVVRRSRTNDGFVHGANAAASAARADLLLFVNNDVELLPGAVGSAIATLDRGPDVGAVGGRLVFPDGTLQEAGSIIWRDGSCQGYGRGDRPERPQYSFLRDVDFSSAAFLLTPRALFEQLNGFDRSFAPAYYEDVDYCVRLWQSGKRVVYDPGATVRHLEFGSSSAGDAAELQRAHRVVFAHRHGAWLSKQFEPSASHVVRARARAGGGQRILLFDDRVPARDAGFGFPRAADLISALTADGHFVTLYPTDPVRSDMTAAAAGLPATVEVSGIGLHAIQDFLAERRGYYDTILVSRSHNMELLRNKLGPPSQWSPGSRIVYDAEAIAAARECGRRRLRGEALSDAAVRSRIDAEIDLAHGVDAVIAVSQVEGTELRRRGLEPVSIVSHTFEVRPTPRAFEARRDFLFVGSFDELSPNADAVLWFAQEVLPLVRRDLQQPIKLVVVGRHAPRSIIDLRGDGVELCADVTELEPFYDRARVFIAPSRFAAGIPYKIGHAAAHGLPVVCTRLLQTQLDWRDGVEILAAETARELADASVALYTNERRWLAVRAAALHRVATEYSIVRFRAAVRAAVGARAEDVV